MRNYFDFKLKGSQIFLYVLAGWVVMAALTLVFALPYVGMAVSGEVPAIKERLLDTAYLWSVIAFLGIAFAAIVVNYVVLFYIVKATVGGLSIGEDRFVPQYDPGRYVWLVVGGAFLSVITLGIYFPWFVTRMLRYFAENTSFRFNTFNFRGKGMALFGIIVLAMVLPVFLAALGVAALGVSASAFGRQPSREVLWGFLIMFAMLFMAALYIALTIRWVFKFSYGSKRVTTDMKLIPAAFYIMGQSFLVMITMGLYGPMCMLRMYGYVVGHMVLGDEIVEDRFGFTLDVWKDYFFVLGQGLLTIITVGIYWPWAYARISTRLFTHSYVETVEERRMPMPEE
jgi:uncharacterized membrane protein YjgN (DUF898 family)